MKEIVFEVLIGAVILGLLLMAIALFRDSMGFIRTASETVTDTGKIKTNSLVDVESVDAEVKGSDVRATLKYLFGGYMTGVEVEIDGDVYDETTSTVAQDTILNKFNDFSKLDQTYKQERIEDADGDVEKYKYTEVIN